jgi:hypothetical protein
LKKTYPSAVDKPMTNTQEIILQAVNYHAYFHYICNGPMRSKKLAEGIQTQKKAPGKRGFDQFT